MTELQLEILFGGMGYEVQNVRIVEDIRTGASKGWAVISWGQYWSQIQSNQQVRGDSANVMVDTWMTVD